MKGYLRRVNIDDSSQIDEVSYDPDAKMMRVSFVRGGSYVYHHVPSEVFGELVSAPSVGKFFAKYVKNNYQTERIGV